MNNACKNLTAAATALLFLVTVPALGAKPTQAEINKARAVCASHKAEVLKLEKKVAADDAALQKKKKDWEHACQHAELLMSERTGEPMPMPAGS